MSDKEKKVHFNKIVKHYTFYCYGHINACLIFIKNFITFFNSHERFKRLNSNGELKLISKIFKRQDFHNLERKILIDLNQIKVKKLPKIQLFKKYI